MSTLVHRSLGATALHPRTADLCVTNAWVEDNGFTVPAAYASAAEEQWALAERVTLSDLSARQLWSVRGTDAAAFLSAAMVDDVGGLTQGRAHATFWCDDAGYVRGAGLVARRGAGEFEIVTSVRDFAWLHDAIEGFDAEIADLTGQRATLGVRGPLATALLAETGLASRELHPGDVVDVQWRSMRVGLLRRPSGSGFEIHVPAEDAVLLWDRLWRAGRTMGLSPAGAEALDVMRIEDGRLKPGVDWMPAQSAVVADDLRIPQDFGAKIDAARRFNGADGVRRAQTAARRVAVQFAAAEPVVEGSLSVKTAEVGRLTSKAWSEARGEAVALGWIDQALAKPGTVLNAPGPRGPVAVRVTMAQKQTSAERGDQRA